MIMQLNFYNSLGNRLIPFKPLGETVGVYSCGPTVYDYPHIGNFRSFIFSDLLHRVLRFFGYKVKLVMNITDVDDKTITNSRKKGQSLQEYTAVYSRIFFDALRELNIQPAVVYPRATEHIQEMIDLIKILESKGCTYKAEGSVYFKLSAFKDYGLLANISPAELRAGAGERVASDEYEKENVSDFVLWKAYQPEDGDVGWESPFGRGRPGWHIECSAMSAKYLGKHFDIHTGGIDNKFPHHENEIAQSEAAYNCRFVNYWLHCEHLLVNNKKMSKSEGNFYTLQDLFDRGCDPLAVRYLLLSTHYRKQLNFTLDGVSAAASSIKRVNNFINEIETVPAEKRAKAEETEYSAVLTAQKEHFKNALADDLNVSAALAALFELMHFYFKKNPAVSASDVKNTLAFISSVNTVFAVFREPYHSPGREDEKLQKLIAEREKARAEKNYSRADELRDIIKQKGYQIKDTPSGPKLTADG